MHSSSCNCPQMLWPWVPCGNVGSTLSPWWREEAANHVIQCMNKVPVLYGRRNCCFSASFFGEKRDVPWDCTKGNLHAKDRDSEMGRLKKSLSSSKGHKMDSFFCSCHQRCWLIKWTKQRNWRVLGTRSGEVPPACLESCFSRYLTALSRTFSLCFQLPSEHEWGLNSTDHLS